MIAAPLLLLTMQVAAPGPANWAFVTCMTSSASEMLRDKPSREIFRHRLADACPEQRARQRQFIVDQQVGRGRSRTQAEGDADEYFAIIEEQLLDVQP
jgi:hypothetical protein